MQMMCCRTHKRGAGGFIDDLSKKTQSHLLKVTLWVGTARQPADGDVAVAGTLVTGVRPP